MVAFFVWTVDEAEEFMFNTVKMVVKNISSLVVPPLLSWYTAGDPEQWFQWT